MPAPEPPRRQPSGHLPRLPSEWYRGQAAVFWTHTIAERRQGWLDTSFHAVFREHMLHAAVREQLLCPIYSLMPDHLHLIWMGVSADSSNQRSATSFLREQLEPHLAPARWQHQPHDHVLREDERKRGAFVSTCYYIARESCPRWTRQGGGGVAIHRLHRSRLSNPESSH